MLLDRPGGRSVAPLSYQVPGTTHRVVVTTPALDPELWQRYLEGAVRSYREHHVESVLDLDRYGDGVATTLLFTVLDEVGTVIGGMRAQGPYTHVDESHAVVEWAGDPGLESVRADIARRLPCGVAETKAGWVSPEATQRREIVACLSRAPIHAGVLLGVRSCLGTSAVHTVPMWTSTGAVVVTDIAPVRYPDERYLTRMLWWDLWDLPETISDAHRTAYAAEAAEIVAAVPSATPAVTPTAAPSVIAVEAASLVAAGRA